MTKRLSLLFAILAIILAACSGSTTKPDGTSGSTGTKPVDPPKKEGNPAKVDGGLKFVYKLKAQPVKEIFLTGGFNGWNPYDATYKLSKGADGVWSCTVKLPAGRWEYKFVVDGQQYEDTFALELEPDGTGGKKSMVTVK